jgi:hypothetical protein
MLYLAVWNDLSLAQRHAVEAHLASCERCRREQSLMQHVTLLITRLEESQPSARADAAVWAAIAAQHGQQQGNVDRGTTPFHVYPNTRKGILPLRPASLHTIGGMGGMPLRYASIFVATLVVLLAVFTTTRFVKQQNAAGTFLLPATLSWSAYILYHAQTERDDQGNTYRVMSYHDLSTQWVHVETQANGLDVVYIGSMKEPDTSLAMDEIHHIAQRDAPAWGLDDTTESMFDLPKLRRDLQTQNASYLDKDTFRGQSVYRIRCENGLTLLLDTHYQPVNVLAGAIGTGTGEPVFDSVRMYPRATMDTSMWTMQVPNGFSMGTLPAKP